jgi:hypothetical protein
VRFAHSAFRPFVYLAAAAATLMPAGVALSSPGEIPPADVNAVA